MPRTIAAKAKAMSWIVPLERRQQRQQAALWNVNTTTVAQWCLGFLLWIRRASRAQARVAPLATNCLTHAAPSGNMNFMVKTQ
jgi:hypothetical protein